MDTVVAITSAFSPYAPVLGTFTWCVLIISIIVIFRTSLISILESIRSRIAEGGEFVIGPTGISLKELDTLPRADRVAGIESAGKSSNEKDNLTKTERINKSYLNVTIPKLPQNPLSIHDWDVIRENYYDYFRGIFLCHILSPTESKEQEYDIYIFLSEHRKEIASRVRKQSHVSHIRKAEFFLGRSWGNRTFEGQRRGNIMGIRTAAYGPFLCLCRVTFEDGFEVLLSRYIDFEMGHLLGRKK